jgi:adenosylcobyric acid synthase
MGRLPAAGKAEGEFRVRRFGPQNVSSNAAVTADGGEITRAGVAGAIASGGGVGGMNPLLLKPPSETVALPRS